MGLLSIGLAASGTVHQIQNKVRVTKKLFFFSSSGVDCQTREVIARSIYTANKILSDKRGDGHCTLPARYCQTREGVNILLE